MIVHLPSLNWNNMWKTSVNASKISGGKKNNTKEPLLVDVPFTISFNHQDIYSDYDSPNLLKELGVGYLFDHHYIQTYHQIQDIEADRNKLLFTASETESNTLDPSGSNEVSISPRHIVSFMSEFQDLSTLYRSTGIAESSAFILEHKITYFSEALNRFHAYYKSVGQSLINQNCISPIFICSGKICLSLLKKLHTLGIQIVISRSGITSQAYTFATHSKMTLIGFSRGKQMTIYTDFHILF